MRREKGREQVSEYGVPSIKHIRLPVADTSSMSDSRILNRPCNVIKKKSILFHFKSQSLPTVMLLLIGSFDVQAGVGGFRPYDDPDPSLLSRPKPMVHSELELAWLRFASPNAL